MKGSELRRLRGLNGKTLATIAEPMGITPQAVSQIEKRDSVGDDTVARYLGAVAGVDEIAVEVTIAWGTADAMLLRDRQRYSVKVREEL